MKVFLHKLVSAAVLSLALLLHHARVDACSCIALYRTVCEYSEEATVVLHGLALSSTRSEQVDINDDVYFTVQIIDLYKGEDGVDYGDELTFVTGGNSALCGVDLIVGEEYLIGLYQGWYDGELNAQACGLFRTFSSLTDEELAELGNCDDDPSCDLTCGDFQECLIYMEGTPEEEDYCADTCEPGACGDEESCSLVDVTCVRSPCPPVAVCSPPDDTCSNGFTGIEGTNDHGTVCCPLACNQCGGSGCARSGIAADLTNRDCCINGVLNNQLDCSVSIAAPCIIASD